MKKVKAIVKEPGAIPHQITVSDSLGRWQKLVGGYIEVHTVPQTFSPRVQLAIICNEDGRIMRLAPNCMIAGMDFVGTIVLVGMTADGQFTDCPISISEAKRMYPWLWMERTYR